ncbi:MAG: DUF4160 domain-containing protein [Elusimicrobia bacterium]|nr:DUF4160 domain-containing protein [Elusimicrobiota bacterium]
MPTIFRERGFRFHFYSNENFEPCHVHVSGKGGEAKFWVPSCQLVWNHGFNRHELGVLFRLLQKNMSKVEEAWNEHFGH